MQKGSRLVIVLRSWYRLRDSGHAHINPRGSNEKASRVAIPLEWCMNIGEINVFDQICFFISPKGVFCVLVWKLSSGFCFCFFVSCHKKLFFGHPRSRSRVVCPLQDLNIAQSFKSSTSTSPRMSLECRGAFKNLMGCPVFPLRILFLLFLLQRESERER